MKKISLSATAELAVICTIILLITAIAVFTHDYSKLQHLIISHNYISDFIIIGSRETTAYIIVLTLITTVALSIWISYIKIEDESLSQPSLQIFVMLAIVALFIGIFRFLTEQSLESWQTLWLALITSQLLLASLAASCIKNPPTKA